jgi:FkbM family methyltransferase
MALDAVINRRPLSFTRAVLVMSRCSCLGILQTIAIRCHRQVAGSKWLAAMYLAGISAICRNLVGSQFSARVANLLGGHGIHWPQIAFRPRSVVVGTRTEIMLTPHIGEFDWAVLFGRRLEYEQPVFCWLEQNVSEHYDTVIEIGANVGVYSVFFDSIIKANPNSRLRMVIAFEPALEPYARLLENLKASAAAFVLPFRAAVADATGFRIFYEPNNHLTNGSFDESFSRTFSDKVTETFVLAISPRELEQFFSPGGKVLVKIDVEGYEPALIAAFKELVSRYQPDFLIEVLDGAPETLEQLDFLVDYERCLIGPDGLQKHSKLRADERHRDWLLRAPAPSLMTQ